jgi:hypothetical protein
LICTCHDDYFPSFGEHGKAEVDGGLFIAESCLGELGGGDEEIIWEGREVHVRDLCGRAFYKLIWLKVLKPKQAWDRGYRKNLYIYLSQWQ